MSRREDLLDLAADLLETEGVEAFGIGVLARAAGFRPPSLYKHFSGREDIENALIARGFATFATALSTVPQSGEGDGRSATLAAYARAYREQALARPQLYRLMTGRPLDRAALPPGAEDAAMAPLLRLFGEDLEHRDRARAAWAWAHGLVSLEIAGRFPPGADIEAAWQVMVETLMR